MTTDQLESRLAAVEKALAEMQKTVADLSGGGVTPGKKWWESDVPPMTPEQEQAFDDAMAYGRYYRMTGKDPPPDWKPGDPIPEPEPGWVS